MKQHIKQLLPNEIEKAADYLLKGEIVAFPTETVYGLGAVIFNPSAIQKIFFAKNRPSDNPLIAHVANFDQIERIAYPVPRDFFLLAEKFWPGPLTMLVRKKDEVPNLASAGLPTIGIRMPAHPLALELIRSVGEPLVAPSANLSGKPSATCSAHVAEDFSGKIAAVLDGGPCQVGLESTVLDLESGEILRPGAITGEEIAAVLGRSISIAHSDAASPRSPGMKYRHYAPQATVIIFHTLETLESAWQPDCCVLAPWGSSLKCPYLPLSPQTLYAELRAADKKKYRRILVYCDAPILANQALMNRLLKASSVV